MVIQSNSNPIRFSKAWKCYVVRRIVVLHDVQEFVVTNAKDEWEAQEIAEALMASYSADKALEIRNVEQVRCEIVDIGENATWSVMPAQEA